ncbi:MAG: zinc-binding dehydrogenase, partial [Leptospirales bacterium]
LERVRDLGASETIKYKRQPEWQRVARDLTDGRGADHIIEIGGAGTLERSLQAARPGGTVNLIGVMGPGRELDPSILLPAIMRNLRLQGIFVGSRQDYQAMNRAIAANQMRPIIDRTFAFDQAPEAIRQQGEGERFGKLVVQIEMGD